MDVLSCRMHDVDLECFRRVHVDSTGDSCYTEMVTVMYDKEFTVPCPHQKEMRIFFYTISNCYYTRNKYVFFGESVIKSKLLQSIGWSSAGEYHTDVIFYTQGSARKTISDINNNSVKLVESITK